MQNVHNRQRNSLARIIAKFKNMKIEIQKLKKEETQNNCNSLTVVADQIKNLINTMHKLSIDASKMKKKKLEEKNEKS